MPKTFETPKNTETRPNDPLLLKHQNIIRLQTALYRIFTKQEDNKNQYSEDTIAVLLKLTSLLQAALRDLNQYAGKESKILIVTSKTSYLV